MTAGPLLPVLDAGARSDALRAAEDLAREPGSACLLGPAGEILYVNEAWDRFARENGGAPGVLGASLLGKRYTGFVSGLAERSFHDGVLLRVQSGQLVSLRAACSAPDLERDIESVFRPVRLGTGMGVAVVHTVVRASPGGDAAAPPAPGDLPRGEAGRLESTPAAARERRLEAELLHSQRHEAIGRLAGGVAHDFNNLLTVVIACADEAARAVRAREPVDVTALDEIRAAARRGTDLARQLLQFARREPGVPAPVDTNRLVQASEKILRRLIGEDVKLELALCPDAWPAIADPIQLDQVLMNLAVNARDAMPSGGTLRLETGNFRNLNGEGARFGVGHGDFARLAVSDTGTGMPPDIAARCFEPFFTTKGEAAGTGLGLSIVQRVVRQARGGIAVTTAPGRGTTFEIVLPRSCGERAADPRIAATPERAHPQGARERVLLVEDDPLLRSVMARALSSAGHEVVTAGTGPEALALSGDPSVPLDLVVSDVILPGLNGPAVVAELRRLRPGLAALFTSGHEPAVLTARGVLPPGAELLAKPFTGQVLLAAVRAALERARGEPGPHGTGHAAPDLGREEAAS